MEERNTLDFKSVIARVFIVAVAIIVLMLVVSIFAWMHTPPDKTFVTHWGINGQPDAYNGRDALFTLPACAVILAAIVIVLPLLSHDKEGIVRSSKAYCALVAGILSVVLIANVALALVAFGVNVNMNSVGQFCIGLMFIVLGNYLGKMRRNFYLGVRTPWAFASELSWAKTQRLGGRLFVAFGLLLMVLAFVGVNPESAGLTIILVGVVIAICVTIYSYLIWRQDPNRQQPRFWSR